MNYLYVPIDNSYLIHALVNLNLLNLMNYSSALCIILSDLSWKYHRFQIGIKFLLKLANLLPTYQYFLIGMIVLIAIRGFLTLSYLYEVDILWSYVTASAVLIILSGLVMIKRFISRLTSRYSSKSKIEKCLTGRSCFLLNTVSDNPHYKIYESYVDEIKIRVIIIKAKQPELWKLANERGMLGFNVLLVGKSELSHDHYTCSNL